MSIYDDIKSEKLQKLLKHLNEQEVSEETTRFIKRVEQQIEFLRIKDRVVPLD